MSRVPPVAAGDLECLVTYDVGADEDVVQGIVNAFYALDVDVMEESTPLAEWIEPDLLTKGVLRSDPPVYLYARIWGHPVAIGPDEVRIYAP